VITGSSHITDKQLILMEKNSMDIESHTVDHINLAQQFNPYILIHEMRDSKQYLINLGIKSNILILPNGGGSGNILYRLLVGKYYDYSRGQLYNIINNRNDYNLNLGFNRYNIPSIAIGNYTTQTEFESLINQMTLRNQIVIITYHRIENISDSYLTVSTAHFIQQMNYLKLSGVKTITLKQYLEGK